MIIGEFNKSTQETVRVSIEEFKNRKYLDIRIYYLSGENEWKPTKKGVTVSLDLVSELSKHIKKAEKEIEKQ